MLFVALRAVSDAIQTHKRFKRTQCFRTKHSMRILGVIPLIKLQNNTQTNRLFVASGRGLPRKYPCCVFCPNKKRYFENFYLILCVLILFQNTGSHSSFRSCCVKLDRKETESSWSFSCACV